MRVRLSVVFYLLCHVSTMLLKTLTHWITETAKAFSLQMLIKLHIVISSSYWSDYGLDPWKEDELLFLKQQLHQSILFFESHARTEYPILDNIYLCRNKKLW